MTASKNFVTLSDVYRDLAIEFPSLKGITLAQWAMESGWGQSGLSAKHQNYAGMKWGKVDAEFGGPLQYGNTKYTEFTSPSSFIHAYWHRLDNVGVFKGWRLRAEVGPEAFLTFITPGWLTGRSFATPLTTPERGYVEQVTGIWTRRTRELFQQGKETEDEDTDDSTVGC